MSACPAAMRMLVLAFMFLNVHAWLHSQAPDLFDVEHSLKFARYLEQQQRYDLALEEYHHVEELAPGSLEVRMALMQLYARINRPMEGISLYEGWNYNPFQAPAELRRKYVGLHFQGREFLRLDRRITEGIGLTEPERTRIKLHLALYISDWEEAAKLFETFEIQHVRKHQLTYAPIMAAISHTRFRKPWLGATLSLVPGGGQVYAGQWVDGLSSLLLVGVTGFEAYRLFSKRGPTNVLAWGLGGLSLGFYISNIYGGHRAAERYNERQNAHIRQVLDDVVTRDF